MIKWTIPILVLASLLIGSCKESEPPKETSVWDVVEAEAVEEEEHPRHVETKLTGSDLIAWTLANADAYKVWDRYAAPAPGARYSCMGKPTTEFMRKHGPGDYQFKFHFYGGKPGTLWVTVENHGAKVWHVFGEPADGWEDYQDSD